MWLVKFLGWSATWTNPPCCFEGGEEGDDCILAFLRKSVSFDEPGF